MNVPCHSLALIRQIIHLPPPSLTNACLLFQKQKQKIKRQVRERLRRANDTVYNQWETTLDRIDVTVLWKVRFCWGGGILT
jgi:hypothetical protein